MLCKLLVAIDYTSQAFCTMPCFQLRGLGLAVYTGQFHEQVFQSLDWLIVEAKRRGLRILFALTNYGGAYGGMCQYVKWSCQRRKATETDKPEAFYSDSCCQDIFQNFIATITCRVNALTGRAYRCVTALAGLAAPHLTSWPSITP